MEHFVQCSTVAILLFKKIVSRRTVFYKLEIADTKMIPFLTKVTLKET